MDPQKLSQLDPKLRDAYQRVMGTTIPVPQTSPTQQTQSPSSADGSPTLTSNLMSTPQSQPVMPTRPDNFSNPEPVVATTQPKIEPQPQTISTPEPTTQQPASNFVQMNSEVPAASAFNSPNFSAPAPQVVAFKKKNGGMMMPILFGIVGLVFIVVYTFFWTKIFNLKLPFLP